jgi:simple sugar transport system permease protein
VNIPIETSVNQATGAPNVLGGDSTQSFLNRLVRPDSGQSVLITIASSILAIVIALLIAGAILLVTGKNPIDAYSKMWQAGTTSVKLVEAMQRATPLIMAAVAVAIGFKMNLFNIGVEGQYLIGVFFAAVVGSKVSLPPVLHVTFILLVAMVAGAAWSGIAAYLKVKKGVNEVIATIMLNAIALSVIDWLFTSYFRYESSSLDVKTKPLAPSAWMPVLFTVTRKTGNTTQNQTLTSFFLVALLVVVLFWLVVYKSTFGFRLRASGYNAVAARTAGISSGRMIVIAMLMSGAVAGLVGMPYLLGDSHAYGPSRPDGYGFNGIAVALLGRNHPAGIIAAAFLWGFLDSVSAPLQIAHLPQSIVLVLKAIILITVVIVNEVVGRRVAKRTADRTAAALALPNAVVAA